MKPNYKNWVPKGMVISVLTSTVIIAILFYLFFDSIPKFGKILVSILLIIMIIYSAFCVNWYSSFSYNGKRQIARRVIEGIAHYVELPENGKGLDIGCGSGALTIAVAKNNPNAMMIGLDRWGKEYASFNKSLCENNAKIEGVSTSTQFIQGDACKLDFADATFDAVTSNYCYHNIPGKNRQDILLETLRVLKKGGVFVIHDLFTKNKYGNMDEFIHKLKEQGYEKVELIDTTDGLFLSKKESTLLCLSGSALLIGRK